MKELQYVSTGDVFGLKYFVMLLVECKVRGYDTDPIIDSTELREPIGETVYKAEHLNRMVDWLVENYPNDFSR